MQFRDVIQKWPSKRELASDLGCTLAAVEKWEQRNSIPSSRWLVLLSAAKRRRIKITPDSLVAAAGRAA